MNICIYACMYVLYAYMRVCMHLCVYACMYACVHTCKYTCNFQLGFERYGGIVLVGRGIVRVGIVPREVSGGIVHGEMSGPPSHKLLIWIFVSGGFRSSTLDDVYVSHFQWQLPANSYEL